MGEGNRSGERVGGIQNQTHSTQRETEEGKIVIITKQQKTCMKEKAADETQECPQSHSLPPFPSHPHADVPFIHFIVPSDPRRNGALCSFSLAGVRPSSQFLVVILDL